MSQSKILVTTDLSKNSSVAFPHAAFVAKKLGADATLIHVDETMNFGFHSLDEFADHFENVVKTQGEHLDQSRQELESYDIAVSAISRDGIPWQMIQKVADELKPEMVVVTKLGARGLRRMLLGSTTTQLVRHMNRPTLVVPTAARSTVAYDRLLFATDFSKASRRGLDATIELAEKMGASVQLIHVLKLPQLVGVVPGEVVVTVPVSFQQRAEKEVQGALDQEVKRVGFDKLETKIIVNNNVAEALAEAPLPESDLLVIPAQGKGAWRAAFLGSTTESVLKLTETPVLVLPSDYLKQLD